MRYIGLISRIDKFSMLYFIKGVMQLKHIFIWLIRFYQKYLSGLKTRYHCIYTPTCSQYGIEAIQKYGVIKGGALTIWRILRCNPFAKGGYDPVP